MKNTDKSTHWDGLNCFLLVFNYEVQMLLYACGPQFV